MTGLRGISSALVDAAAGSMPPTTMDAAKTALLHNLTVAGAGTQVAVPGESILAKPGSGSWAWRVARQTTATDAILLNSLTMGARAQHDEHPASISHFGSVIIPSLLAAAEQRYLRRHGTDAGRKFLESMVLGYQAGAALGTTCLPYTKGAGRRPTGLFGPFAGAAAVGTALGQSKDELVSSLAFALSSASGTTQVWTDGTDEWRWQTAFAARAGYESAMLATAGTQGAPGGYDGTNGFLAAVVGVADGKERDMVASQTIEALHDSWAVEHLLLKPFPVCAINQSAVNRVVEIGRDIPNFAQQVQCVEITMSEGDLAYPGVALAKEPTSWAQAMMSLPYGVALAVARGRVTFEEMNPPIDPLVSSLMGNIRLVAVQDAPPGHAARVRIRLRHGALMGDDSWHAVRPDLDAVDSLARHLEAEGGLNSAAYTSLREAVLELDQQGGLPRLLGVIRQTVRC